MIVCHCNVIRRAEVRAVIRQILIDDPWTTPEPHCIYRRMNKSGRCCCCFPTVCRIVEDVLSDLMNEVASVALAHQDGEGGEAEGKGEAAGNILVTGGDTAGRRPSGAGRLWRRNTAETGAGLDRTL